MRTRGPVGPTGELRGLIGENISLQLIGGNTDSKNLLEPIRLTRRCNARVRACRAHGGAIGINRRKHLIAVEGGITLAVTHLTIISHRGDSRVEAYGGACKAHT